MAKCHYPIHVPFLITQKHLNSCSWCPLNGRDSACFYSGCHDSTSRKRGGVSAILIAFMPAQAPARFINRNAQSHLVSGNTGCQLKEDGACKVGKKKRIKERKPIKKCVVSFHETKWSFRGTYPTALKTCNHDWPDTMMKMTWLAISGLHLAITECKKGVLQTRLSEREHLTYDPKHWIQWIDNTESQCLYFKTYVGLWAKLQRSEISPVSSNRDQGVGGGGQVGNKCTLSCLFYATTRIATLFLKLWSCRA